MPVSTASCKVSVTARAGDRVVTGSTVFKLDMKHYSNGAYTERFRNLSLSPVWSVVSAWIALSTNAATCRSEGGQCALSSPWIEQCRCGVEGARLEITKKEFASSKRRCPRVVHDDVSVSTQHEHSGLDCRGWFGVGGLGFERPRGES